MGGERTQHLLMAASVMVIIPVVVLFFATQRYFVQGIVLSGIKG
jgi:multiple sugar transport system permease protein